MIKAHNNENDKLKELDDDDDPGNLATWRTIIMSFTEIHYSSVKSGKLYNKLNLNLIFIYDSFK